MINPNEAHDMENLDLRHALRLLFVKGSEGAGSLRLNATETQALATYVRHLRMRQQRPHWSELIYEDDRGW